MSAPAPKPFSLQSPEHIAQEYGGNKQKIAQAVQMGIIDPTSGLMAGMFIDRMRSAQAQEQAPQQTVAQKVLGPRPSQMPPQGGLGGLPPGGPQGGPPGAPPMQMASAAPPPGGPAPQGPVGMAEGGLTTLPVPDYMFDEHTFAGGGIVAFAKGGNKGTLSVPQPYGAVTGEDTSGPFASAWQPQDAGYPSDPGSLYTMTGGYTPSTSQFSDINDAYSNRNNPNPTIRAAAHDFIRKYTQAPRVPGVKSVPSIASVDLQGDPSSGMYDASDSGNGSLDKGLSLSGIANRIGSALASHGSIGMQGDPSSGMYDASDSGNGSPNKGPSSSAKPASTPTAAVLPDPGLPKFINPKAPQISAPQFDIATGTPRTSLADIARSAATAKNVPTPIPRPGLPTDVAGVAPALTGDALIEQRKKDYAEANKLPEYKGTSAEDKAARKNEDLWSALAQAGFGMMAGTSQNALTNIGAGLSAAMPGMQASLKERRADEKDDRKQEYAYQLAQAGVKGKAYEFGIQQFDNKTKLDQEKTLAEMRDKTDRANAELQAKTSRDVAGMQLAALGTDAKNFQYYRGLSAADKKEYLRVNPGFNPYAATNASTASLKAALVGLQAQNKAVLRDQSKTPEQKKSEQDTIQQQIAQINSDLMRMGVDGGGGYSAPPPGAVRLKS